MGLWYIPNMGEQRLGNALDAGFLKFAELVDSLAVDLTGKRKIVQIKTGKSLREIVGEYFEGTDRNFGPLELDPNEYRTLLDELTKTAAHPLNVVQKSKGNFQAWMAYEDKHREKSEMLRRGTKRVAKITDAVMGGVNAIQAVYTLESSHGVEFAAPLAISAYLHARDFFNNQGKLSTAERNLGLFFASLPALGQGVYYMITGDQQFGDSALLYSAAPVMMLINGTLIPFFKRNELLPDHLYNKSKRIARALMMPKDIRVQSKKLENVLKEIENFRGIEEINSVIYQDHVADFEAEVIKYLEGRSGISDVRRVAENIHDEKTIKRINAARGHFEYAVAEPEPVEKKPEVIMHPATYQLALNLGADEQLARKIGNSIQQENAELTRNKLQGIVQSSYEAVLQANPAILLLSGKDRKAYFSLLSDTLGRVRSEFGDSPLGIFTPEQNPTAFSTIAGLGYLNSRLDEVKREGRSDAIASPPDAEWIQKLANDGYTNFELVKAILTEGFRLGQSRPRIGMQYSDFITIRRQTAKAVSSRDMQEYNNYFRRLISDGVILMDKDYKSGGGKFGACHSLNPQVNEILRPGLREYVAQQLYAKGTAA